MRFLYRAAVLSGLSDRELDYPMDDTFWTWLRLGEMICDDIARLSVRDAWIYWVAASIVATPVVVAIYDIVAAALRLATVPALTYVEDKKDGAIQAVWGKWRRRGRRLCLHPLSML